MTINGLFYHTKLIRLIIFQMASILLVYLSVWKCKFFKVLRTIIVAASEQLAFIFKKT